MVVAALDSPPRAGLLAQQDLAPQRRGQPAPSATGRLEPYLAALRQRKGSRGRTRPGRRPIPPPTRFAMVSRGPKLRQVRRRSGPAVGPHGSRGGRPGTSGVSRPVAGRVRCRKADPGRSRRWPMVLRKSWTNPRPPGAGVAGTGVTQTMVRHIQGYLTMSARQVHLTESKLLLKSRRTDNGQR